MAVAAVVVVVVVDMAALIPDCFFKVLSMPHSCPDMSTGRGVLLLRVLCGVYGLLVAGSIGEFRIFWSILVASWVNAGDPPLGSSSEGLYSWTWG